MTNYSRRDTVKGLGALLSTAVAGCTAPTNNDMNEVDQALEEDCQSTGIETGEQSTVAINGSEYTLEGAGVYDDKAALKVNGKVETLGEGGKVRLDDETAYITEVFNTGDGKGVVEVSFGGCQI